jgi:hypothetical protein
VQLQPDIPAQLRAPAEAAVAWINAQRASHFHLTGVVETDAALSAKAGEMLEFGVVLCDDDVCAREQVRVTPQGNHFQISLHDIADAGIPALLDPPPGVRRDWLDDRLAQHDFILLLFYRGRW